MTAPFDPICLFEVLDSHDVAFVVVGGIAAVLHGSPLATVDADIVPKPDLENLERLGEALRDLQARIRTRDDPRGVEFDPHPALLSSVKILNLTTRCGDLDLTFEPAAVGTFDDLLGEAVRFDLDTVTVNAASLEAVIRSKRAADRPRDRAALPVLEALRDELDRRTSAD